MIQFGPAERAQFGVNDTQSFSEQMPAVVRYLKDSRLQAWHGVNQLYATINAEIPTFRRTQRMATARLHSRCKDAGIGGRARSGFSWRK